MVYIQRYILRTITIFSPLVIIHYVNINYLTETFLSVLMYRLTQRKRAPILVFTMPVKSKFDLYEKTHVMTNDLLLHL